MAIFEIDIQVYCSKCDNKLNGDFINDEILNVEPCKNCMKEAYDEGYYDGKKDGEGDI